MHCKQISWLVFALSLIVGTAVAANAQERGGTLNTITVGPGADCEYSDLQSAINAAPDNTELRLENETFTGNFEIDSKQNLVIQGGFDSCSEASPGFSSSLDAAGSGRPLQIEASVPGSEVTLRDINLKGGNTPNNESGAGLQIVSNQGAHEVTLENVIVSNNTSGSNGGGIQILGAPDSRLKIRGDSIIQNNSATGGLLNLGGGISCSGFNGGPLITFDSGLIFNNSAEDSGGGIFVDGCRLLVNARGVFQGVIGNSAGGSGGGILARRSDVVIQGDRSDLVAIGGNSAQSDGGGIAANDSSELEIFNASISDNSADRDGGAIALRMGSILTMEPSSASACELDACSVIEGNSARSGGGIYIFDSDTNAVVRQTFFSGNTNQSTSEGSVGSVNDGTLLFEGNVIHENSGTELFQVTRAGTLTIAWSTLADNTAASGDPALIALRADDTDTPSVSLYSNAIWNPGRDVLFINELFGSNYATEFDCLISNELATLTGFTRSFVDDPEFVDSAGDDYHLQTSSPAIDACDDANPPVAADLDGDPRGRDYGASSAQVFDIGADEVWFGIFSDRFEQ